MINWIRLKDQTPPEAAILIFCPDIHSKVLVAGYYPNEKVGKQFKCEGHRNLSPTHWAYIENYPEGYEEIKSTI